VREQLSELEAVFGPMYAGKTTYLIGRIKALQASEKGVLVFKPTIDNRYGNEGELQAHNGARISAILVNEQEPVEILREVKRLRLEAGWVVIDEAMFFPQALIGVIEELRKHYSVLVAGLDTNFRREPFGIMPQLIDEATKQVKLTANCYQCGGVANYTMRKVGGEEVMVGAGDMYLAACLKHHVIPGEENE